MTKNNAESPDYYQLTAEKFTKYENHIIENWKVNKTYENKVNSNKEKYYCLVMFPYPSGRIHMGHVRNYTMGDVVARYKILKGFDVLHPMGWDAFGLPAENAAIKNQTPPAKWTYENISAMRKQLIRMGYSYDWSKEIATCKPGYYKWNQFIFLKMFEKGWAYKKKAPVNWCNECDTVLANEQVVDGCCWRHEKTAVEKKELSQWFFKITDFAEDLLDGHEKIKNGWPNRVLTMQKNWIGKSKGTKVLFKLEKGGELEIFTTRIDTLFGVSYMATAPEHPLLETVEYEKYKKDIFDFKNKISKMSDIDRENPDLKEGIFTGLYAIHPFTNEKIPVYAANFVLPQYGTGAVMAVPAHDQRDFEFAKKYNLPVKTVIFPNEKTSALDENLTEAYTEYGILKNSGIFDNLTSEEALEKITKELASKNQGSFKIQYRLRDWLLSRQRYWGTPIPVVYCENCGLTAEKEENLPVILPENVKFDKASPLPQMKEFVDTKCPKCNGPAKRETDTMDTFIDSSWYFLRYLSARDDENIFSKETADKFLPVDQYIGGIEHANMHLLYSRYFTKALHKLNFIAHDEPFKNLLTQGMVIKDGAKMSKSLGNVVDPDLLIEKYGADTIRIFTMFAAPPEKDLDWSDSGVEGSYRFIKRIYRFIQPLTDKYNLTIDFQSAGLKGNQKETALIKLTHKTISVITDDLEKFSFNTAIARLMEYVNFLYADYFDDKDIEFTLKEVSIDVLSYSLSVFLTLLLPYAPFISVHFLTKMGLKSEDDLIWPSFNPDFIVEDKMKIVIQINGKLRDQIEIEKDASKENILISAKNAEKAKKFLEGKNIVKEIYVPGKLVNLVIK
ncbi:MAG: leucine--tRNA ligase [Spirochaetia bacterium]|nr:leucine--tRNA ligase [Spirochaetia bacterium]